MEKKKMTILGLETSCDETAAAILECGNGNIKVLSNIVSSQVKLHAAWGGVVPNLAAREHLKNIIPVIKKSFQKAGVGEKDIDLIAVTSGPGLIPALLIGTETAKTLSYFWQKPLLKIHHIEGHIYANFIGNPSHPPLSKEMCLKGEGVRAFQFPILCLVVSGGHTQLVLMKKNLDYEIVGETLDDAAGEAFDKVARILDLGYPGGPAISARAEKFQISNFKFQISDIVLPRPMINAKNFNFSFSGLKTAVLYLVKKNENFLKDRNFVNAVCAEFQQAVCDVLISKTVRAGLKYNPKTIMLAGGVSANTELRLQLEEAVKKKLPYTKYRMPDAAYSLDNAAMIAAAGYWRYNFLKDKKILKDNWKIINADANLKLK